MAADNLKCPCIVQEKPVPPCTWDTCFHFSSSQQECAHCNPLSAPADRLAAENARLREENRKLKKLLKAGLPRLLRLLEDDAG
jgi:hypothetical protein